MILMAITVLRNVPLEFTEAGAGVYASHTLLLLILLHCRAGSAKWTVDIPYPSFRSER
jgi:hypothetical protein